MECPRCSHELKEEFNYCPVCGYRLLEVEDLPNCRKVGMVAFADYLKNLRLDASKEYKLPAYCIFPNKGLDNLVKGRNKIRCVDDLYLLKYVPAITVERIGDEILSYLKNPS